jgi:hypothetical protein
MKFKEMLSNNNETQEKRSNNSDITLRHAPPPTREIGK